MEKKDRIRFPTHLGFNIVLSLVLIVLSIVEIIMFDELCPLIMIPIIVILFLVVFFSWMSYNSKIMKHKKQKYLMNLHTKIKKKDV